jgi:hypothetical protein
MPKGSLEMGVLVCDQVWGTAHDSACTRGGKSSIRIVCVAGTVLLALTGTGMEVAATGLQLGTLEGVSAFTAFNKVLQNLPGGMDDPRAVSTILRWLPLRQPLSVARGLWQVWRS